MTAAELSSEGLVRNGISGLPDIIAEALFRAKHPRCAWAQLPEHLKDHFRHDARSVRAAMCEAMDGPGALEQGAVVATAHGEFRVATLLRALAGAAG